MLKPWLGTDIPAIQKTSTKCLHEYYMAQVWASAEGMNTQCMRDRICETLTGQYFDGWLTRPSCRRNKTRNKETNVPVTEENSDTVNINECKLNQSRQSWLDREYYLLHPPPFTAAKYFMFPSRPICQLCIHWSALGHLSALQRLPMSGPSISPCSPLFPSSLFFCLSFTLFPALFNGKFGCLSLHEKSQNEANLHLHVNYVKIFMSKQVFDR